MRMLALVCLLCLTSACAPVSVQSPEAKRAYTADQVVLRLNELENAAIQANGAQALPDATTRLIVQFVVGADQTAKAAPLGWQATILSGWQTLKAQLPAKLPDNIALIVATVDALIGGVQ